MPGHVSLLVIASLIILVLVEPSSSDKLDQIMLKRSDRNKEESKRHPRVRMVKKALRIEDGVFLKPKRSTGEETLRRYLRKEDVLNEYNDWATVKKETLWYDNLVRMLKKRMRVMDENLVKRLKEERVWDKKMLKRMI